MTQKRSHALHQGERVVQQKRHTPEELASGIPNYIHTDMPQQHAEFYVGLSYLPLSTLDQRGRPWASIVVTQSNNDPEIGIGVSDQYGLNLTAQMNPHDPFFRAIDQSTAHRTGYDPLFAGVGVDFSNRRRNKLSGTIDSVVMTPSGKMRLHLKSDAHLGNCPKYITVRSLVPYSRTAKLTLDSFDSLDQSLPEPCKELIGRVSTVFLATKHVPQDDDVQEDQADMGLNHRGGAPGFVRVYEEAGQSALQVTTYLVLPDYSGNRFYQSLGNIQSSKLVGLVFPEFTSGHMLYVTGEAENLFDDEAEALMPRMSLVTRIRVTGAVFIEQCLNLRMTSDEQRSPYNPPIRFLRQELEALGHAGGKNPNPDDPITATLVSVRKLSSVVSTFSFQLSRSIEAPLPGGFGVFDFSQSLETGYSHMNEENPQAVNEDFIRTWTLSSAPIFDAVKQRFKPVKVIDITVKHQPDGLVSSFLHQHSEPTTGLTDPALQVDFKGTGGGFSCFNQGLDSPGPSVPEKMLWVVGGVGITPFMSMWDGIINVNRSLNDGHSGLTTDIVLVFAGRADDLELLRHFLKDASSALPFVSLSVRAYQSADNRENEPNSTLKSLKHDCPNTAITVHQGRLDVRELGNIDSLFERQVFLCGPDSLMRAAQEWLQSNGDGSQKIHQESYFF